MILILVLGVMFTYFGFYGETTYSPVLFVQGMIMINIALNKAIFARKRDLNRL